ncbi:PAS domain-containing protein [Pseudolysinimonas sp.]|jgi:PAS domain S-box-containing protein|uniref:PAS domain-containing protein n=1 Tax=Pseudolysinimonas sp. TaxID=2680009 RepID=UPI0037853058
MSRLRWRGAFRRHGLRALFEAHPDPVYFVDTDGKFVAGNAALADRVGIPWEILRGMDFGPTVHPDDRERVAGEFARAAAGETRRYRSRGLRPDGSTFFADVLNVPIRSRDRVLGVLGLGRDIDDLADVQTSLDVTERLLQIAGRVARVGGWATDLVTGERHWSPQLFDVLGLDPDQVVTRGDLIAHVGSGHRARVDRAFTRCATKGTAFDLVAPFRTAAGELRQIRLIGEAVRAGGRIVRVQGAVTDVTAAVEQHRERIRMDTLLTAALDGVPNDLVFVDRDWRLRYVNRAAAATLGIRAADLIGADLWTVTGFGDDVAAMLHTVMASGTQQSLRLRDPRTNRWVETLVFPADDLLGISMTDVSEREAARLVAIGDPRKQYAQATVFDSTSDAIIVRGLGDGIEYFNSSAAELLALDGDEDVTGQPLLAVLGADAQAYAEADAVVAAEGNWTGDLVIRRNDEERLIACRWVLVRDPSGAPEAVFCVLIDVTEARREGEVMLRAQRMESIGTLAGGIAHDLNNVLTPLMLSTQLLAGEEDELSRLRIIAGMQEAIERGSNMIRQVLTFARGVEGQRTLVEITDLVERFTEFCRDTLPKNLVVEVEVVRDLRILGDPTQLLQVLMNLATNARDVMPDGGSLTVRATGDGDRVRIAVTDTGPGMTPSVLDQAFDPFFTTKAVGQGTGLGLSVSQAIARAHDGSLDVTATGPAGTTFVLDLPRATASEAPSPAAPAAIGTSDLTGVRVLIVDDEDAIIDAASAVIRNAGGEPVGARDAEEAKVIVVRDPVDLVLTDLVMPGTTGRAFLAWLATRKPGLAVVTMSGVPEQGLAVERQPNVRAVLDKPFTAAALLQALAAALPATPR